METGRPTERMSERYKYLNKFEDINRSVFFTYIYASCLLRCFYQTKVIFCLDTILLKKTSN